MEGCIGERWKSSKHASSALSLSVCLLLISNEKFRYGMNQTRKRNFFRGVALQVFFTSNLTFAKTFGTGILFTKIT